MRTGRRQEVKEKLMKYNDKNKPIVCMMTQSTCYKGTTTMTVNGILWHDTGCNNANIKRYVQPSDNDPKKDELLKLIGTNANKNDWNHTDRKAGVNAFIGKLADGTIATVQTMPWNYRPWGVGKGNKGTLNDGWIQFEICEDAKKNADYAKACYNEAVELTAYLCKIYGIDPNATVTMNGVKIPTVCCHGDASNLGFGDGHVDIYDWLPTFGFDMATARKDIKAILDADSKPTPTPTPQPTTRPEDTKMRTLKVGSKGDAVKLWQEIMVLNNIKVGDPAKVVSVDGDFGQQTKAATLIFQKQAFPTAPKEWDAIVGAKTWTKGFESIK